MAAPMLELAFLLRAGLGFLIVLVAAYWLPSIIAAVRGHHQIGPIVVINLFFGWTIVGWVAALAWSVSHIREREA